jgi:hypothetical protein
MRFFFIPFLFLFLEGLYGQNNAKNSRVVCEWSYIVRDEFSGKEKKALKAKSFFGYTPEAQRRFFAEKDYLECEGFLVQSEDKVALHLLLTFQDKEADTQIGSILPNATLTFNSIKGKQLTIKTYKGAAAQKKGDLTVYECSYPLTKSALKKLKNFEIDTVLLNWSKGFQVYDVFYLDFLKDQICCIE